MMYDTLVQLPARSNGRLVVRVEKSFLGAMLEDVKRVQPLADEFLRLD